MSETPKIDALFEADGVMLGFSPQKLVDLACDMRKI
jgi:hypothetical protein